MKNKGFTLIELLAVIVILAIIALIAVPIVLNIIENSKKESIKVSAEYYIDAVNNSIAKEYLKDSQINLDGTYEVKEGGKKIQEQTNGKEITIEYDGEAVIGGTIVIGDGKIKLATNLKINNYFATLESSEIILSQTEKVLPGLYDENWKLITLWEDLVNNGTIILSEDGKNISDSNTSIAGKLVISEDITKIGEEAFATCKSLTEVTIPASVTSIGDAAFVNSGLTTVTIPGSVESIGNSAFRGTALTSLTIENGVKSISDYAFALCQGLTKVTIPESVTSIDKFSFGRCLNLSEINVDEGNSIYSSKNGVLYNKDKTTLINCPGGKKGSFVISNNVTSVGDYAFYYCKSLTSVTIPDSVISIGDYALSDCTSLTEVTIGNSVKSIGYGAFNSCTGLTTVTIPGSVTVIGDYAFRKCTNLTATILGSNVTIVENVFYKVPTVYYAGYQEGIDYSSWGAGQVLPIQ